MVFLTNYADGQFKKTVDNSYLMNQITKRNNNFNFYFNRRRIKIND